MRLIETTHLKNWAGSNSAKGRFPHLVKELICAVIEPDKLRFPSGDAVWVPGFDGTLLCNEKNRFVPMGQSVWEAGTQADYMRKAIGDYNKRSKDKVQRGKKANPDSKLNRSETTFVFVTPRVWPNKDNQVAKWKKENIWNDVVIIDGVDLQDWLEVAPAVTLRFAAELGFVPEEGLQIPEQAWEDWSHRTKPPASEELVVIGREEQEKDFIGRLSAPSSTFTVRGDSPREAWGFALACLRCIHAEQDRQSLYARTIVADNEDVASRLRHLKNVIILLKQAHGQVPGYLSSHGCHVIVPEGNDIRSENVIELGRPTHRMFADALRRMNLQEEEAERITRACGRSVTILQRQRPHANFERPRWADGQTVLHLLPAVLAGRWNNRREADQQILCQLAGGLDYQSVEGQLQEFLFIDEPPLQKVEEVWALTAPVDAFQLTARRLTTTDLDRFKHAFREVFGRIDPKVELPPDQWLYHDIKGERVHSGWLRSGMAEVLLLIAERGVDARLVCVSSPRAYVDGVVRGLPGLNDDWRVLASLRDHYALLMEAAPGPLLDSLERLLEAKPDDLCRLFVEGGIFSSGSMHTGLLWGLETLAWSSEYLSRVTLLLAKLARLDPGGGLSNRPINSLREIFLWWHTGTNASIDQRLAALDLILEREPQVGWALLTKLLPSAAGSIAHPTAKPRWRDFGDPPQDTHNRRAQLSYASAIVDRALERLGTDPERWRAILESVRVINATQWEKMRTLLDDIARGGVPADVKASLWEVLRDFIAKHRSFSDAHWALPADVLNQLEAILVCLAPDDPVEHNRWLFEDWLPDVPFEEEGIERHEQKVEELRRQAVQEIIEKEGTQGLVRLGVTCKFPGFVAHAAVPLIGELDEVRRLTEQAIIAGERGVLFAGQLSGRAQQLHGEPWCERVRKDAKAGVWSSPLVATLMLWWPDTRATWEEVEALGTGVKAEYWRRKPFHVIEGSSDDQSYQIDQLIEVGRAAKVFDSTALHGETLSSDTLLRIFDATFEELAKAQTADEVRRLGLNPYDMRRFLDQLRNRSDISRDQLARREYQALPVLGSLNVQGLTLHEFMAEDPNFFLDVLCEVYLPAHRDKSTHTEPTAEAQARAQAAYTLLETVDRVPGQREGQEIDEAVLMQWIHDVRTKAADRDRAAIADQQIGRILAHAPADPEDNGWPQRVVRNAVERLAADDIDEGLMVERYNMRGIYNKALYEGGTQERALASQYRGWADISRAHWPRMARLLETMAEQWEEYARRGDAEAEQDKLRFS